MSFLRNLGKIFTGQPLVLQMWLTPEKVHMVLKKGDRIVAHRDLLKNKAVPVVLERFLQTQPDTHEPGYYVTFPLAKRLSEALKPHQSDSFQIETTVIDQLRKVDCPADFNICWQFDPSVQSLRRLLEGADGYLGDGWFYRGNSVWKLQEALAPSPLQWLEKSSISSSELYDFVTQIFPWFQNPVYKCDLTVESDFQVNLRIIKILKHSADFQITSNRPDVQKQLKAIQRDPANLISGNLLLPGLAQTLRGDLLHLAQSGEVKRISGNDLLAFLQDDLSPVANALTINIESLRTAFPIDDAFRVPFTGKLEHNNTNGIGRYEIVPCVQSSDELIPITMVERAFERGERFLKAGERWLEFTPRFRERSAEWKQHGVRTVRLDPLEVMGAHTERLDKLRLTPPHIDIEAALLKAQTEGQKARVLIDTMRYHGLPVGLYGLQLEMSAIIAEMCLRLLTENPSASILWLVPGRKKEEIARVLRRSSVPFDQQQIKRGHVLLISPEKLAMLDQAWELVIFNDLDVIASGEKQAGVLASIRREWSIGTFNRTDWHQNNHLARRVLTALRLNEQALALFLRICTGTYTDQPQGFLSRLIAPFRTVTIPSDDANKSSGDVPIPPRPQPSPPKQVEPRPLKNTDQVYRPSFTTNTEPTLNTNYQHQPSAASFVKQAKKYIDRVESPTEPVPFMQYWPTYEVMTSQQQKWYFYWRSQVRVGNYLPADKSYIFVYVYEVLNLIGFQTPEEAFEHLKTFWQNYRNLQRLDGYLVSWIADFSAVYKLSMRPMDWYVYVLEAGGYPSDRDVAIEAWLSSGKKLSEIPIDLLRMISDYNPKKSKFYEKHNETSLVDQSFGQALEVVDKYLSETTGTGLIDTHRPDKKYVIKHWPFGSALVAGHKKQVTIGTVANWSSAKELRASITAILKYTENLLRRQHNFKGTLRGIEIPSEWSAVLDLTFAPASDDGGSVASTIVVDTPIVIDFKKVGELTAESNEVRDRLTVTDNEDSQEEFSIPSVLQASEPTIAFNLERPADTPDGLLTELEGVYAVIQGDHEALDLLRYLRQSDWQAHPDAAASEMERGFLSVIIDRINERAQEELGDHLIFEEDNLLVVTDDYRDELEYLLSQIQETSQAAAEAPDFADLTPEWVAFVTKMQPQHWEALSALLMQEDVVARLDGIARSVLTTADLLIDEINEFALSSTGDIVIEPGDLPVVEEEDIEALRSLMAWAQTNIIQEI